MRKFLCLALGFLSPAGCTAIPGLGGPHASVGWNVSIGTPSTLTVPATAVIAQGSPSTGALPVTAQLAAGTVGASSGAVLAASEPCAAPSASHGPALAATASGGSSCTLQTVCDKLDTLISRTPAPAPAQKLPAGPAAKEE